MRAERLTKSVRGLIRRQSTAFDAQNRRSDLVTGTTLYAPFRPLADLSRAVSGGCGKQPFVPAPRNGRGDKTRLSGGATLSAGVRSLRA
jgi:hypothetical protein